MPVDINLMVGGEAGQGVQSVGFVLSKALARGGFHIFADQDYDSRIRGGHNFFRVRARDTEVGTISETLDLLLALNQETVDLHWQRMARDGVIVANDGKVQAPGDVNFLPVPLERLAEEKAGAKLMANTVGLGAALGLAGYDLEILNNVIREHFGAGEIAEGNVVAAGAGYEFARDNFKGEWGNGLTPIGDGRRMLLTGNESISLGALAAGCKFMAAYPMTPATSIMEYLAAQSKEFDLVMVHAEDEISVINMIIGAAYAGARAMTATSGGGFCLMVEGLGLAGITETPIVVVDAQRPGPAIGLPTRTEQGDLQFALHASHGEFPRAVLAPATIEDAFWVTIKAFNIAEKYQLPVIILTDQHLASSYATVDKFDLSKVSIDRGLLLSAEEAAQEGEYKRHRITESGISPRALPPQKGILVATDSDEHNEEGHLIEDAETRTQMMLKRLRKLEGLRTEINPPRVYGPEAAETTLIGWGSTYGAIREAVDLLQEGGLDVNLLHLSELWPFPAGAVSTALRSCQRSFVVENNATAQLAHLISAEIGHQVSGNILKFDGRPFSPAYIATELKKGVA